MSNRLVDKISLSVDQTICEIHGRSGEYIFDAVKNSHDFYEGPLLRSVHSVFSHPEDGLFVDVGANIGNHTVYFANVMEAKVLAIEPVEDNLAFLRKNVQANGLTSRVEVTDFAAWNVNEQLHLKQAVENNSGSFSIASEGDFVAEGKRLDDILEGSTVSLIKIDVEGAEFEVLEGAIETIKKWRPLLIIEAHGAVALQRHRTLLEPLGYHLISILGRSDNYIWASSQADAERMREEFHIVNHRREQRNLNASLGKQLSGLERLAGRLEKLTDIVCVSEVGASDPHSTQLQSQNIENKLADVKDDLTALRATDANVASQLTQLAIELGRQSAITTESSQRIKEVSPLAEESASLLEAVLTFHASLQERITEVLSRLDGEDFRDLIVAPVTSAVKDVEASLQTLKESAALTRDLSHHSDQKTLEYLEKVLAKLDELATVQTDPEWDAQDSRAHETNDEAYEILREQRDKLVTAYQGLSRRFERYNPELWNSEAAMRALQRITSTGPDGYAEQPPTGHIQPYDTGCAVSDGEILKSLPRQGVPYRQRVRVGIASMPGRETTLAKVLSRIAPQADEVLVYLNNMESVPQECSTVPDNVHFFTGPDLGDRGKFRFLEGFSGYYLTVDDDIDYSRYHVISLINAIEKYKREAIVGWHGSIFQDPFEDFYDPTSRKVLTYGSLRGFDTPVHLLGTGVCGFHTDSIRLRFEDFQQPNMADVFLAIQAKEQNVPMLVIAHEKGEALPLETIGSISDASLGKKEHEKEKLDVRARVTSLVKESGPWPPTDEPIRPHTQPMNVAVIGRTNPKRWRKGGILKSCLLTRQMLLPYGCKVHLADIIDGDPIGLEGFQPDIVMVYVGDPERPDFKEVHQIVEHHAERGVPVLVNLSEDSNPERTRVIARVMESWHHRYAGLVKMMAFTPSVQNVSEYRGFAENIVCIPKTLTFENHRFAEYETTSGIFVGDVAKLSDPRIVGTGVENYLYSLREALPEAKIYGVRQYKPKYAVPSGIDEVWPYLSQSELAEKLVQTRLMVNFAKYATYEMVPVEAAAMGLPILHRNMPQSLNTALGLAAQQFTDPSDLAFTASALYRTPVLWRQHSRAGMKITQAQDFDLASAQMYMALYRVAALRHFRIES